MTSDRNKLFRNVCPKNCYSSCTMISTVENGRIAELKGDQSHPYTKGKLCAKGFSFIEANAHRDRLKFPYYQKVKGTGKFVKITWEKAYDMIVSEMVNIYKRNDNFLSLGFYKGTGNLGVHHYVTEKFFTSMGETTKIIDSSSSYVSLKKFGCGRESRGNPLTIKEVSLIIIWGANPAATNVHLIPFIIEAKVKGSKVVVIDPLYTQTAELADLFIQIRPGSDGAFASLLIKGLLEKLPENESEEMKCFAERIRGIPTEEALRTCGVSNEAISLLQEWLRKVGQVAHLIGNGVFRSTGAGQSLRMIEALAEFHGDLGKEGGGVCIRKGPVRLYNSYLAGDASTFKGRLLDLSKPEGGIQFYDGSIANHNLGGFSVTKSPVEMLWISCGNPLTQAPQPQLWSKFMQEVRLIVTVDHYFTPTANMSNLVLPTTTHFEEFDLVLNDYHQGLAYNEKAISPYYESRSEWNIMKELALRLERALPGVCTFPVHSSEEEYLDAQFNDRVFEVYGVRGITDLKRRMGPVFPPKSQDGAVSKFKGFEIALKETVENEQKGEFVKRGQTLAGKSPTEKLPFWLLTPHHPYRLNSQFHFLNLSDEKEAYVGINETAAKKLGIFNGEIVRVFNEQDSIEIKALYSNQVPEDIVYIYEGWYPESDVNVNRLISVIRTNVVDENTTLEGMALYNTFVNIEKL